MVMLHPRVSRLRCLRFDKLTAPSNIEGQPCGSGRGQSVGTPANRAATAPRPWRICLIGVAALAVCGCHRDATDAPPPGVGRAPDAKPTGQTQGSWAQALPAAELMTADSPRLARDYRVVHVFVCLADNRNQGIVPVPAALGNGQDPANNLYWGAMYGVKTFFKRSAEWEEIVSPGAFKTGTIDRAIFRSRRLKPEVVVVAEAYDGAEMKQCLENFLAASAGDGGRVFGAGNPARNIAAGKWADMVCFVGHNGLMDIRLDQTPARGGKDGPACAVVLACKSRDYFTAPLAGAGCKPLVLTTGLMAPEAYTLDAVIRSWAAGKPPAEVGQAAAEAYAKYQKCSLAAAKRLFSAPE